jgi:hypothetical protein
MDTQPETTETIETTDTFSPNWGDDAPRGGKAVMNRILKEKATVPLFFALPGSGSPVSVATRIGRSSRL